MHVNVKIFIIADRYWQQNKYFKRRNSIQRQTNLEKFHLKQNDQCRDIVRLLMINGASFCLRVSSECVTNSNVINKSSYLISDI